MKYINSGVRALAYLLLIFVLFPHKSFASEIGSSVWTGVGEGAHGENGTLILGVDVKTNTLSGYYESSDRSGHLVAECRFFFRGQLAKENTVPVQVIGVHPDLLREGSKPINGLITYESEQGKKTITVYLHDIPASCDWLYHGLPSYSPPKRFTLESGLLNDFYRNGAWRAVNIIRSEKSYLHNQPNDTTRRRAYLVSGDLIYIYDEAADWYYVEYQGERKVVHGWIKKADTVQYELELQKTATSSCKASSIQC